MDEPEEDSNQRSAYRSPTPWASPRRTSRKHVYLAVADGFLHANAARAVGQYADGLFSVADLGDSLSRLRQLGERALILVGSRVPGGELTTDALRALRCRDSLSHVVLVLKPNDPLKEKEKVAALARAGLDEIVWMGGPDQDSRLREVARERFNHALPPDTGSNVDLGATWSRATAIETWCLRNSFRTLHVNSPKRRREGSPPCIADFFGVDPRTVYSDARRLGWESALEMVDSARLVHVAVEIDAMFVTAMIAAKRLEFTSRTALHNFVRRHCGMTLSQLRERGATPFAMDRFRGRKNRGA